MRAFSTTDERPRTKHTTTSIISSRSQLSRLFRLILILQSERNPNARELADSCEVSRRTVYRDLEILEAAGIPIRYRRECQGYQLGKGFFLQPIEFDEAEALAMFVLARQLIDVKGFDFLKSAHNGALKLVQNLPEELRKSVLTKADVFRKDSRQDLTRSDSNEVYKTLIQSIGQGKQIRVWCQLRGAKMELSTKFSLYRIILDQHRWFIVGRSSLSRRIEIIAAHDISQIQMTNDVYSIPARFNLKRFLGNAWRVDRGEKPYAVSLRFNEDVATEVTASNWHHTQRVEQYTDGRVILHFQVDGLDEIVRWILSFGKSVEVLAPGDLRFRIREIGETLARTHRP